MSTNHTPAIEDVKTVQTASVLDERHDEIDLAEMDRRLGWDTSSPDHQAEQDAKVAASLLRALEWIARGDKAERLSDLATSARARALLAEVGREANNASN